MMRDAVRGAKKGMLVRFRKEWVQAAGRYNQQNYATATPMIMRVARDTGYVVLEGFGTGQWTSDAVELYNPVIIDKELFAI